MSKIKIVPAGEDGPHQMNLADFMERAAKRVAATGEIALVVWQGANGEVDWACWPPASAVASGLVTVLQEHWNQFDECEE